MVENFFPTGYGFLSYTLLGSTVIRLPFIVATSLGHEVAHPWFGNGVLVDYRFGNWSEGLTTYLADHLYRELSSPEEGREYRLQILRDYAALVPPEKDFTRRVSPSSRAVGCGKGAMVFHMARRMVVDRRWICSGISAGSRRLNRFTSGSTTSLRGGASVRPKGGLSEGISLRRTRITSGCNRSGKASPYSRPRRAATATQNQPMTKAVPPTGVIAPSHRMPLKVST